MFGRSADDDPDKLARTMPSGYDQRKEISDHNNAKYFEKWRKWHLIALIADGHRINRKFKRLRKGIFLQASQDAKFNSISSLRLCSYTHAGQEELVYRKNESDKPHCQVEWFSEAIQSWSWFLGHLIKIKSNINRSWAHRKAKCRKLPKSFFLDKLWLLSKLILLGKMKMFLEQWSLSEFSLVFAEDFQYQIPGLRPSTRRAFKVGNRKRGWWEIWISFGSSWNGWGYEAERFSN